MECKLHCTRLRVSTSLLNPTVRQWHCLWRVLKAPCHPMPLVLQQMCCPHFHSHMSACRFSPTHAQGWGYDTSPAGLGPLWKSTSGEYSNLRWDVPPEHIQYYWKKVGG